eukprot:snap_masked-scaffold_1-processed-gene-25.45-mRNA-1 protein AED:0.26 eAED:0.26 QI:0/-1/0/1/-1/1/1/0/166
MKIFFAIAVVLNLIQISLQKAGKDCEVCTNLLSDAYVNSGTLTKKSLPEIEERLEAFCGDFSTIEKKKASAYKKLCYFLQPIKRSVSQPLKNGVPAEKVCDRLKKQSSEICGISFPVTVDVGNTDYSKMRVKQLKKILRDRGQECKNCLEKDEFVKLAKETEHLEL